MVDTGLQYYVGESWLQRTLSDGKERLFNRKGGSEMHLKRVITKCKYCSKAVSQGRGLPLAFVFTLQWMLVIVQKNVLIAIQFFSAAHYFAFKTEQIPQCAAEDILRLMFKWYLKKKKKSLGSSFACFLHELDDITLKKKKVSLLLFFFKHYQDSCFPFIWSV